MKYMFVCIYMFYVYCRHFNQRFYDVQVSDKQDHLI
jgi:hypothetical protein